MMTASAFSHDRQIAAYTDRVLLRYYDNYNGKTKASIPDTNRRAGEKAMLEPITRGDLAAARTHLDKLLHLSTDTDVGQMSYNSLQQLRYTVVSCITLYCRAALDGGLPERIAYGLSDSLIQTVDELDNAAVGPFLCAAMLIFTGAVNRNRFAGKHPTLRQCHEYIIAHLDEPIRLPQLAEACGRNPRYLSDLFEKELGIRPTAYIRRCKLEASCQELQYTQTSIAAIADFYAFPSPSAYCAQFQEAYGVTPRQFRKQLCSFKPSPE
ncbi:MAG: helix-turn-helix transcriptional regulator [Faecousia sp.]